MLVPQRAVGAKRGGCGAAEAAAVLPSSPLPSGVVNNGKSTYLWAAGVPAGGCQGGCLPLDPHGTDGECGIKRLCGGLSRVLGVWRAGWCGGAQAGLGSGGAVTLK